MYFARSQALPGKAYLEALPRLRIQEAEPRGIHSQAEPGNDKTIDENIPREIPGTINDD